MPAFINAIVREILSEREGLQRVTVERLSGFIDRAYVLTGIIGPVVEGDEVVINTTAVELRLGTGGWHVVHWNLSRSEWIDAGRGHIMKARYTSLQFDAGSSEEDYNDSKGEPESLDGMPVVVCLLHSQIAAVAVAAKAVNPDLTIAYVMTDQAALPLALSDLLYELTEKGLIDITISAGQAFGGFYEAVNVMSALGIAKHAGADITIVAQGPGVVGTGTRFGFSGIEAIANVNYANIYGGRPIFTIRYSDADGRERHRGMSHQALTVLESITAAVAIPTEHEQLVLPRTIDSQIVHVGDMTDLFAKHDLTVTSMGRSVEEDPNFFAFAGASGVLAARLAN